MKNKILSQSQTVLSILQNPFNTCCVSIHSDHFSLVLQCSSHHPQPFQPGSKTFVHASSVSEVKPKDVVIFRLHGMVNLYWGWSLIPQSSNLGYRNPNLLGWWIYPLWKYWEFGPHNAHVDLTKTLNINHTWEESLVKQVPLSDHKVGSFHLKVAPNKTSTWEHLHLWMATKLLWNCWTFPYL